MGIYANPEHYCGHFELVVNLVTYDFVQSVVRCVRESPQALVVFDEASQTPCPSSWVVKYYDRGSCDMKRILEQNDITIMNALHHDLVLVKKIGPLSFYRHAGDKAAP